MAAIDVLAAGKEKAKPTKACKVTLNLPEVQRDKIKRFAEEKNFTLIEACTLFLTVGVEAYEDKHGEL